jgi:hypothetical protein
LAGHPDREDDGQRLDELDRRGDEAREHSEKDDAHRIVPAKKNLIVISDRLLAAEPVGSAWPLPE